MTIKVFNNRSNLFKQFIDKYGMKKRDEIIKNKKSLKNMQKSAKLIDKNNIHLSDCTVDDNGNILKRYVEETSFWWESKVYVSLVETDIFPLMTATSMNMTYYVHEMRSLRTILKEDSGRFMIILYELFNFVKKLTEMNFLHGNLHIDNIYVRIDRGHYIFKLVDLSNAYVHDMEPESPFYRSSFLGEFNCKETHEHFSYWDFFTLMTSLKCEYVNDQVKCMAIDKIMSLVIKPSILEDLREVLSPKHRTMYFEKQIFWDDI